MAWTRHSDSRLVGIRGMIALTAVLCGGCGLAHNMQVSKMAEEQKAECRRLYPDEHQKPISPRVNCMNDVVIGAAKGDANADIVNVFAAKRMVVADKYDRGQLSAVEYDAEMASLVTDATTLAQQRENGAAVATAAATQAAIAQNQAIQSAFRPAPTTTCQTFGNTTTCR